MSWLNIMFLLYQLIAIGVVIHVIMDNRQPVKTMAWGLVIFFVPVIGIVAYLFFGVNTRRERMVGRRSLDQLTKRSMLGFVEQQDLQLPGEYKPIIDLFINQSFSLPFNNNKVELLTSGYEFFPMLLRDIAHARNHIHVDMYIFEDDALGRLIADALMAKAREGVEVRVIYDDVGCWSVSNRFYEQMREAGIEVEAFLPVRFPSFTSKANYRNHRKIVVIDGLVGYIGGMNIALRYVKGIKSKGTGSMPWRDTMVRIEGRGVYSLQRAFLIDWYFVDRTLLSNRNYYPSNSQLSIINYQCAVRAKDSNDSTLCIEHCALLQTVTSSPTSPYPEIMQGYVRLIMSARRYIYIETPYFLPTDPVLFALKTASQTGVDVRLLAPRKGDARITEWACRSYLREAQEAGIQVSLYEAGFLHSKLMVCDDKVCTCGSTNVDFRSFENNFEANTFFYDEQVAQRMRNIFLDDEQHSVALSKLSHRMHPTFRIRLLEGLARLFSPLL
ncbi:MAG: cardiolipin synthase [Prevotella sp.]|nr:cardiolipin synthase [Prevotella sp.]